MRHRDLLSRLVISRSVFGRHYQCTPGVPLEDRRLGGHAGQRESIVVAGSCSHWSRTFLVVQNLLPLLVHSIDRRAADEVSQRLSKGSVDGFDSSKFDRCELDSLGVAGLVTLEDG